MRLAYTAFVISMVVAPMAIAAGPKNASSAQAPASAMRPSSIAQLKKLKFNTRPKVVKKASGFAGQVEPTVAIPQGGVTPVTNPGNEIYRRGEGLVLKPSALEHPDSSSGLSLPVVAISSQSAKVVGGASSDGHVPLFVLSGRELPGIPLFWAYYNDLASGAHTYLLTVAIRDPRIKDHLVIKIGNQTLEGDDLLYSASSGDIRAMFTFTPGADGNTRTLHLTGEWSHSDTRAWYQTSLPFHYVQLAQLD